MREPRLVAAPPAKPLLIFDGDCGFCRRWILRWKAMTGRALDYAPSQEVAERFPEIPKEAFARSVQLVLPSGEVFEGAEAVFRSRASVPGCGRLLAAYRTVPGFAAAAEFAYRQVARHRRAASAVTRVLWGARVEKPTYGLASALFLRLLGLCYFVAFVSLWVQVDGLIGSHGILPVGRFLEAVRGQIGSERYALLPTLCWLDSGDAFLHVLCGGGALASLLMILGLAPALCLAVCWAFYLSLCVAGQDFLEFQWDLLLLEAGFLGIWLAPARRRRIGASFEGSPAIRALLCWLLFRLMFSSGFVKLASHDPTWRDSTALTYHYWTQPLPPWTAWYLTQLPASFHRFSCLAMFFVELAIPFLIVAPRRLRLFACGAMLGLETLIAVTGNYAFFNLLTIALCILLLDDAPFPERWREKVAGSRPLAGRGQWPRWVVVPTATLVVLVSLMEFSATLRLRLPWPGLAVRIARAAIPFRSVNRYGLFAVMTTRRPEITVEGSNDGTVWHAYEFRWKPGDVRRRPRFVAPHQPRLDWQMWFAALGSYEQNPWFLHFLARLLEGSTDVTKLLAKNPFPGKPPRYVRAVLEDYHFTDSVTRGQFHAWWRREPRGLYCPVLSREMLRSP